jgi:SAM-dependent methyltransferase
MNLYDLPQYLELTFRDETKREADFIEQACQRYGRRTSQRMLEPGCGGGRLLLELARRGYETVGFDSSQPALACLERRMARRRVKVESFHADLARFQLAHSVDAAFCTYNTFRHLLTESQALSHLRCVASCLRPGGIYVLGLHLLPLDADEFCIERWRGQHGRIRVCVTLRVTATDRRRRQEWLRLSMLVRHGNRVQRCRTDFPLRMYTASQFRRLLRRVPDLEFCDAFDFWYDITDPLPLNDEITDTVVVLRKRAPNRR